MQFISILRNIAGLAGRTLHVLANTFEFVSTVLARIILNRQMSIHVNIERVSNTTHYCYLMILLRGFYNYITHIITHTSLINTFPYILGNF
jgi:hypothetical protein